MDRGYFGLHLVLEHHVLHRMNDGGRCIMSKMEPARDIARAGDTMCRDLHSLVLYFCKNLCFRQEPNLAPEILKSNKIISYLIMITRSCEKTNQAIIAFNFMF